MTSIRGRWTIGVIASLAILFGVTNSASAATGQVGTITLGPSADHACFLGVILTDGSTYNMTGTWTSVTSKNGNVSFSCQGALNPGSAPPPQAIKASYQNEFVCWDPTINDFVFTTHWAVLITPTGNMKYDCHFNNNK